MRVTATTTTTSVRRIEEVGKRAGGSGAGMDAHVTCARFEFVEDAP